MKVPEIEQLLVARGLSPAVAAAVVKRVLEDQVRQPHEAAQWAEGGVLLQRILSGAIACVCFVLAYQFNGARSVTWTAFWMLLPLLSIWFGASARLLLGYAEPPSDGVVRVGGWMALLGIAFYRVMVLQGRP